MSDGLRLAELDELERDPEADGGFICDLMMAVGSSSAGLRTLVSRYARSSHPLLPGYVVMALNRAAWDWKPPKPEVCDLVLDFIGAAGNGTHPGMLATTCNALKGLDTNGILNVRPERQPVLASFLLWCLDQERFEGPASCIELLHDLHHQTRLQRVLPATAIVAIKQRLAELAVEDREDLRADLASLRDFWAPPDAGGASLRDHV